MPNQPLILLHSTTHKDPRKDPEVMARVKKYLDSAPTPEARQARKRGLHGFLYGMGPAQLKELEQVAFPLDVKNPNTKTSS